MLPLSPSLAWGTTTRSIDIMIDLEAIQQYTTVQLLCLLGTTWITLYLLYTLTTGLYDVYLGPLGRYPVPKLHAFTITFLRSSTSSAALEHYDHARLHAKYGPIIRYAPRCSPTSLHRAGMRSMAPSRNSVSTSHTRIWIGPSSILLRFNDADDLINADSTDHGRMRNILGHSFSDRALKEQEPLLNGWARKMVVKLREQVKLGGPVDLVRWFKFTTVRTR